MMGSRIAQNLELSGRPPSGYEQLSAPLEPAPAPDSVVFAPNAAYEHYLRMHKVLVGRHGAEQLEGIYESLKDEPLPRYLSAAGWAATEAALIRSDKPVKDRLDMLAGAADCWQRALLDQRRVNALGPALLEEYSYPHRIALDLAVMPLFAGMVEGNIDKDVRRSVYRDCLNIAQSNAVYIDLAAKNGDTQALSDHLGFGYECNALLAFNWRCSKGWFVVPSMARSDSGYHHRHQTHDLLVVHHREGRVLDMTPVEIKASASLRDRERYKALLVRGKMHLSVPGRHTPSATLSAIEAVCEGRATPEEADAVAHVTDRFVDMVRDYCAGQALGHLATERSVTRFRDNSLVMKRHPGLATRAAS